MFAAIDHDLFIELEPNEILVYLGIKIHYPNAFPSHERLADVIGISVTTVQKGMKGLEQKGLVTITRTGRTSRYVLADDPDRCETPIRSVPDTDQNSARHRSDRCETPTKKSKGSRAREEEQEEGKSSPSPAARVKNNSNTEGEPSMSNYGEPVDADRPKPRPKATADAAPNTHKRCAQMFHQGAVKVGHPQYSQSHLWKILGELHRGEGKALREYSYTEIETLIGVFFARNDQYLRSETRDIVLKFKYLLPEVQKQAAEHFSHRPQTTHRKTSATLAMEAFYAMKEKEQASA